MARRLGQHNGRPLRIVDRLNGEIGVVSHRACRHLNNIGSIGNVLGRAAEGHEGHFVGESAGASGQLTGSLGMFGDDQCFHV